MEGMGGATPPSCGGGEDPKQGPQKQDTNPNKVGSTLLKLCSCLEQFKLYKSEHLTIYFNLY